MGDPTLTSEFTGLFAATVNGLSPEARELNRLTSLGSDNWGRLEQEAQGRGVIIRFDNMRYKQETTVSIYTRCVLALVLYRFP